MNKKELTRERTDEYFFADSTWRPSAASKARRHGPGYGFDARQGACTLMTEQGILDSLAVARAALEFAVSTTAMILTIDTVILRER